MRRTLLASISALSLLGSAALAQSNSTGGQGQMITPGQEGGGQSSGTRVGTGASPSPGAAGGQMDPGNETGGDTTRGTATSDCPPAGPANAQGADRSAEAGNKPGC
jgi:hypothetical protein